MTSDVTACVLIYRSTAWLDFVLRGLDRARTDIPYELMVLGNDPEPHIRADPRVTNCFFNADPSEYFINRIYRAMNHAAAIATTRFIVYLNSDMFVSDFWLDALLRTAGRGGTLPTSLLVESGRLESALPEYARNFGRTPQTFDTDGFIRHAESIRRREVLELGRLYGPVLFDRSVFLRVGGYPEGNPPGTTGDRALFEKYCAATAAVHVTDCGSVVYHVQCGEMVDREAE